MPSRFCESVDSNQPVQQLQTGARVSSRGGLRFARVRSGTPVKGARVLPGYPEKP